jgi:hypothetical protein
MSITLFCALSTGFISNFAFGVTYNPALIALPSDDCVSYEPEPAKYEKIIGIGRKNKSME